MEATQTRLAVRTVVQARSRPLCRLAVVVAGPPQIRMQRYVWAPLEDPAVEVLAKSEQILEVLATLHLYPPRKVVAAEIQYQRTLEDPAVEVLAEPAQQIPVVVLVELEKKVP